MELEWTILNAIGQLSHPILDKIMLFFTHLGEIGFIWILIGVGLLFSKKYRKYGIILLLGLLSGLLVGNVFLKNIVARPRPSWLQEMALLIKNPTDYSFPSGHTLSSFIAATILTLTNRKWGYWAIPLASLIAFSRLYLYVHFPSDVLFGMVLGIILGRLVFLAGQKWGKKKK